jgi:hypothetical protein
VQASTGLVFPAGSSINGNFTMPVLGVGGIDTGTRSSNLFDPAQASNTIYPFVVPAGSGNINGPDNVTISNTASPEFATNIGPNSCSDVTVSVDVTTQGRINYTVQWVGCENTGTIYFDTVITINSAAFSGCSLRELSSTFPGQGDLTGGQFLDNNVTGSLQGSTLSLTAPVMSYYNGPVYTNSTFLTASWQLEDCPAVGHCIWAYLLRS